MPKMPRHPTPRPSWSLLSPSLAMPVLLTAILLMAIPSTPVQAAVIGSDVGAYFQAIAGIPPAALAVFFAGMVLVIAIAWAAWVTRAQFVNFFQGRIGFPMFLGSLGVSLAIVLIIWMYASA